MSNISPMPLQVVTTKDPLLSFVKPVYVMHEPSSLKSFTSFDVTNFSNSQVTTTLNLNSSEFVLDSNILYEQPISVVINGTTDGANILVDGCASLRANALSQIISTLEMKYQSTGYAWQIGNVISALSHYGNPTNEKYNSNYDLAMLDQSQDYSDLTNSNRNPLALYSSGYDNVVHRGAYPWVVTVNTPTQAVFTTTLRTMLVCPPLHDQLERGGRSGAGLSHLNNIGVNINFVANAGNRLLSLAKNRNGDVLNVTNIQVTFNQPNFQFVQIKSQSEMIPKCLAFPFSSLEQYPYNITLPFNVETQINVSSFSLSRVPRCMYLFCRPSNNAYLATTAGVHIPDCFSQISKLTIQYDGQTLITPSASVPALYKMAMQNGLVDNYLQFSAQPVLKTFGAGVSNPQYYNGVGSVLKLNFSSDISLYPNVAVGGYNNTSISLTATLKNVCPLTTDFTFYLLLQYDDVIEMFDQGMTQLSMIPLSPEDIRRGGHQSVHHDVIKHDFNLSGGMSSGMLKSGKAQSVIKAMKAVLGNPSVRNVIKQSLRSSGHSKQAQILESVGFGRRRRSRVRGGAYASSNDLGNSLLNSCSDEE